METPRSVLVVDDDRMMRILVTRTLKAEGFEVRIAANATEARLELAKPGRQVDLVLTDIVMPGGMGNDLVTEIRASHPVLPVLCMTSYTPKDLTAHGIDPKGSHILRKPFMPAELVRVVREALTGISSARGQGSRDGGGPASRARER
jgi:two-component system, cell cycle sensor histidine kinase and response regulator CckA